MGYREKKKYGLQNEKGFISLLFISHQNENEPKICPFYKS